MGLVAVAEGEACGEVASEELLLLDRGQEGLVDGLLVSSTGAGDLLLLFIRARNQHFIPPFFFCISSKAGTYLWLLSLLEESLLALLLGLLLLGEVVGGRDLLDGLGVDTSDVDARRGGNDVSGVHSPEGDAIELEGTGDEENTLVEVLEEDNALAAETTGEEDQDGAGLEAGTELGGMDSLADLQSQNIVSKHVPQGFWA